MKPKFCAKGSIGLFGSSLSLYQKQPVEQSGAGPACIMHRTSKSRSPTHKEVISFTIDPLIVVTCKGFGFRAWGGGMV